MMRRSSSVKRIMMEIKELQAPTATYAAAPLEDNIFEWHFTIAGPPDSPFDGGRYHGRIVLPPEYPMKPPVIMMLTPNGRFEVNKQICLSVSAHHPEFWKPSWSIRTIIIAIGMFMPTRANGAIGSLEYTAYERRVLAKKSLDWTCSHCGSCNRTALMDVSSSDNPSSADVIDEGARDLFHQVQLIGKPINSPSEENCSNSNNGSSNSACKEGNESVSGNVEVEKASTLPIVSSEATTTTTTSAANPSTISAVSSSEVTESATEIDNTVATVDETKTATNLTENESPSPSARVSRAHVTSNEPLKPWQLDLLMWFLVFAIACLLGRILVRDSHNQNPL